MGVHAGDSAAGHGSLVPWETRPPHRPPQVEALPPTWGGASDFALVSGHLHVEGGEEKMSKSLRNYVTIKVTRSSRAPRCQPAAVLGGLVWQATPSCC